MLTLVCGHGGSGAAGAEEARRDAAAGIREWGVKGLMLTIQEEADDDLLASLNQFVDETITVDG
ncbi:MAG: hypothetical protein SVW77_00240 [Candidatus Nanohaloarchaea archaeon]|nr:hypothetical protein [Candidatus Nanohaloarchaea archaeon]